MLDQSLSVAALPGSSGAKSCDQSPSTADDLRNADRKVNGGLRSLHLSAQPVVAVRALTTGTVTGSAQSDIALTHGEFVDRKVARGAAAPVRAVYVRVWQREGRAWRILHDFTSSVMP